MDFYYTVIIRNYSADVPKKSYRFKHYGLAKAFAQKQAGQLDDSNQYFEIELWYTDIDHNYCDKEWSNMVD